MQYIKRFLVMMGMIIVILGSCIACGVSSSETVSTAVPITRQQSMATFTPNAAILTKEAFIHTQATQEAKDYGTIQAGGELPTSVGTVPPEVSKFQTQSALGYTSTPMPTLSTGLVSPCENSDIKIQFIRCWRLYNNDIKYFIVVGYLIDDPTQGVLRLRRTADTLSLAELSPVRYPTPAKVGSVDIDSVSWPLVIVRTQIQPYTYFTFNLDTRQWVTSNGTPIPTTPTATATPTGQYIQSLTLINADTDQPIVGYDPLLSGATINFATLGTQNLNIRANTVPATVGSVKFVLDGSPFRIEGGAPYALNGNNGTDYYAWTPSLGSHTLQVIPYSGGNATGTQGTGVTVNFTVTNGTAATATNTTVPPTATRTNTPVPATNTPSGTPKTALFVVSNATSLNAGDTAVKTRLEGLGYSVTLKTATASATSDATGKTLVLISSSVASGDVNTKFKSVTVPVIVWEYALYDDMAMTNTMSGTDFGYNTGTSMVITNASHPLAAGLSGTVNLYSGSTNIPFGVTTANAISVGAVSSTSTRKLEFAYDKNAAMVGGFTVNARRVGIFLVDTATPTNDAWTLFDAAVTWATAP